MVHKSKSFFKKSILDRFRSFHFSKSGVTLTEAMVGIALLGILVVVVLKVFNNYFQGTLSNEVRRVRNDFALELARTLSSPMNCGSTFSPSNLERRRLNTLPNITAILDDKNNVIYRVGPSYLNNRIRILSLTTADYEPPVGGDTVAGITVVANIRYLKGTGVLGRDITTSYRVNVEVTPATSAVKTFNGTAAEPAKCSVGVYREYVKNDQEGGQMIGPLLIVPDPPKGPIGLLLKNAGMKAEFFIDSDRRLKDRVQSIDSPLGRVESLKPSVFEWKSSHQRDLGFIAQDLKSPFPELVREHLDSKTPESLLSVSYDSLIAVNIGATQQLARQQDLNRKELEALETRIHRLKKGLGK